MNGLALMKVLPNTIEPLITQAVVDKTVMVELYLRLMCAVCCQNGGDTRRAIHHIDKAIAIALPDRLLGPLAEHRRQLGHLLDDRLALVDGEALQQLKLLHKQLNAGWTRLHNAALKKNVSATLTGTKYLEGRKLREGEFTFELYETDEAWQTQEAPLTTTHAADGTFAFETMRYEAVGKRFYLIREENGGQTLGDMTYDGTVYRLVVDVTDDGVGNLVAAVQILSDSGEELTEIAFHNVTTSEDIPKTGEGNLMPLLMVMAVCAGGVLTLTLGRKETGEE